MTEDVTTEAVPDPADSRVRRGVLLLLTLALFTAGLRIIDYAFIPPDDALRHAATAVSDRPYQDVVLFDEAVPAEDSTPGWHAVLRTLHGIGGLDRFALVSFSVLFFFAVFTVSPLFLLKRPEAWAIVLLLAIVVNPGYPVRLALGRPFLLSSTAVLLLVLAWSRLVEDPRSRSGLALCFIAAGITTWLHSTWFLIYAVPFAAVVTGERRAALAMLGAVTAGVLVGAMATLQPWTHLSYNVIHVWKTIGTTPAPFRVSELQPFSGDAGYVAFAMLALLGWATLPELRGFSLRHAGATTALAGWVLAFSASRFWTDIGLPAMLALTALLLQRVLQARLPARAPARWVVVGAVAVALHASISANHGRRWESSPLPRIAWLSENPQVAEKWLPGDGGIVYSPEMRVFYSMYLVWPEASWQYVLGPEQGIMPREHLAVLHDFEARQSWEALQPWVDAMRPQDRLIVDAAGRPLPQFEGTEVQPLPHGLAIVRPVDAGATAAADRVDLSPSPLPGAPVGSGPPAAHPDRPGSPPRPGPHE